MNNLPNIQTNQDLKSIQKSKSSRIVLVSSATNTITNFSSTSNINPYLKYNKNNLPSKNNFYDYFNTKIPQNKIDRFLKSIKDEKFIFFIKYGILRRFEGDCEIIYIEIPQIPKKLVVYRRPFYRMKSIEKLNLNNRDLPHIPLFESEDKLKYLSLEMNRINKIDQLISLNSLLYLNLYGNNIKDIENLTEVKKLKVLLLGRNNITKIKNIHFLVDLEILDLHSNKIKYVEGLQTLKKLRILNMSNNLLNSFYELIHNKNLEELNIRKNLISIIPSLSNNTFEQLKKINIGKNLINKLQFLEEFTKLKSLKEIVLEYNPILNNPDAVVYINKLPIKGKVPIIIYKSSIDNTKIADNNRSNPSSNKIGNLLSNKNKIKKFNSVFSAHGRKRALKFINNNENHYKINPLISTMNDRNLSPNVNKGNIKIIFNDKMNIKLNNNSLKLNTLTLRREENDQYSTLNNTRINRIANMNNENINIKINIKMMTIHKQWIDDYNRIIKEGYNGYNNKKLKETFVNQGYIEIDGENNNCLNLYGNCLKILLNEKLYESINVFRLYYFCFDIIMNKKFLNYLKLFKNLQKFCFNYNNIFSVYQLTKLEGFENIENIQINNNEICNSSGLVKNFLIYRMGKLKIFNNIEINEDERILSKNIFIAFDNAILQKEKEKEAKLEEENINNIDKNNDININNTFYDDNDNKILWWNYTKENLCSALNLAFEELEELEEKE